MVEERRGKRTFSAIPLRMGGGKKKGWFSRERIGGKNQKKGSSSKPPYRGERKYFRNKRGLGIQQENRREGGRRTSKDNQSKGLPFGRKKKNSARIIFSALSQPGERRQILLAPVRRGRKTSEGGSRRERKKTLSTKNNLLSSGRA